MAILAQHIKKNPKAFLKYANSKLKNKPKLVDLQKEDGSLTQDDKTKAELLNTFFTMGYKSVAINHVWKDDTLNQILPKKKRKDKMNPEKLQPPEIVSPLTLKNIKNYKELKDKNLTIYSRFTLVLEEASQARMLQKDETVKKYDILSVKPTTEKMFDLACKTLDVDIITFDLGEKMPFYFARPKVRMAIDRGIHFEITYSHMLLSREVRRYVFSNGQALVEYTKGKNIIMSGGCVEEMDLRGPYDVANLGTMFNLNAEQSKLAITTNCNRMLIHAEGRKTTLGVVKMVPKSQVKEKDSWLLEKDQDNYESDSQSESQSEDEYSSSTKKAKMIHKSEKQLENG